MADLSGMSDSQRRAFIVGAAVVISLALYLAGVWSGLYANRLLKRETNENILSLRAETKETMQFLENYVRVLDANLKNMQLEQVFTETLTHDDMCRFSAIIMDDLVQELGVYWSILPPRLEEYERNNILSEEYQTLKDQYTLLSIRAWILARDKYEKCHTDLVPGLYFYSADCPACIQQGMELDKLKKVFADGGKDFIVFTIDSALTSPLVNHLKDYYNINSTPAVVIDDVVYQGRLFTERELAGTLK